MKLVFLSVLGLLGSVVGYNILVIAPMPSRSHSTLAKGIVDPLLGAGHTVTWAAPYTDWKPHKNLRIIDLSSILELVKDIDMTDRKNDHAFVKRFARNVSTITIGNEDLRRTLAQDKYDAVVTEWFFSDIEAGFAAVQQAPWIVIVGQVLNPHLEGLVQEVRSVSTVPFLMFDFNVPMSFFERVVNTVTYLAMVFETFFESSAISSQYEASFGPLAKARGVTLPSFNDAVYNVSVMFVNSHPSIAPAVSLPPNVIDIGGYHIGETKPLPEDIKKLMDASPQGVIYFSMGSVLKGTLLSQNLRKQLIEMFSELPYTVFWKFEDQLSGLPKNVIINKWWPQSAVLAHPNIKLFITHGGLLSTLEAIHHGVPLLSIPVFGDQPSNAARAVRSGFALKVPYSEDMGAELKGALNKMVRDDSYYKQAKYLSRMFNNRPVAPSTLITHYIELAIESQGAYHLRSKSRLYPWYQRWFVDQLAVVLLVVYCIYSSIRRVIGSTKKPTPNKKTKKN